MATTTVYGAGPHAGSGGTAPRSLRRPAPGGLFRRFLRGRPEDPAWARPALLGLLVAGLLIYLWDLGASGYANSFYAAAVQAGTKSWKAFFFGSSDAANFITVDKPPASLWVMELSGRLFGFSSWTLLVPQALEGVATIGVVHAAVKRWWGPGPGLLAGAVVALTPVAALMFRFDNPDALLVLLLTLAGYATMRAIEDGRSRWMVLAGALIGFGFLTKELQAFLVVPAIAVAYLLAGPPRLGRRIAQVLAGGVALIIAAGWWMAVVQLTPAADRPYIGGSQDNSLWNVIFGYNGFGRLTGNESGSVGGGVGRGGAGIWGPTGWNRLFLADMGGQASWLLPAALLLLVAALVWTRRAPRNDRTRAGLVLWGGSLLVTTLTLSFGKGIIHPYYTVALAPLIGTTVAVGGWVAWQRRGGWSGRVVLAAAVVGTALWAMVLLRRSPGWYPWLQPLVVVAGVAAAVGISGWPWLRGRGARATVASVALVAVFAGPAAYTADTVAQPHNGAIPSAGPAVTGTGFGGFRRAFGAGGPLAHAFPGGFGGGGGPATRAGLGPPAGLGRPGFPGGQAPGAGRQAFGGGSPGAGPSRGGPGGGGLLNAGRISKATAAALAAGGSRYTWIVATVGSESASGYQLATGRPVMSIGGFNGTDPAPTLAEFEAYVEAGRIHYFIGGGGFGGGPGGSGDAQQIASWVESHFTEKTVGGVTVYDLTEPSGAATTG